MKIDDYQKFARTTAVFPDKFSIYYLTLGLVGEAGEVAEKIKKLIRDYGGELTDEYKEEIIKELGDIFWYAAEMASSLDVDLSYVLEKNIEKLSSRKDRGAIGGSGDNR